jgi:hypothetical protein
MMTTRLQEADATSSQAQPERLLRSTPNACCAPAEQVACCEPKAKDACCGDARGQGCGCR